MNLSLILIIPYLAFCCYTDIKSRYIPLIPTTIISVVIIVIQFINIPFGNTDFFSLIISFIPGIIMILISFLSRESIGYGDSILLSLCCICIGTVNSFFLITCAFIYSAIFSLFLLLKGRKKNETIPFIPFIFLSLISVIIIT